MTTIKGVREGDGFKGKSPIVLCTWGDGAHHISVVSYLFDDGTRALYVCAWEDEGHSAAAPILHAFSEAVHILMNVGDVERFQISTREPPSESTDDARCPCPGLIREGVSHFDDAYEECIECGHFVGLHDDTTGECMTSADVEEASHGDL